MTDQYLDCTGRVRTFRLSVYGAGRFLEAVELLEDGEHGLRFVLPAGPDGVVRDLCEQLRPDALPLFRTMADAPTCWFQS